MEITGIHHTSYTVADLEQSLAFYCDLLDFELLWKRQITEAYFRDIVDFPECVVQAAHLRVPGSEHVLELFEYVVPRVEPNVVPTNTPGSSHIALFVDDLQALYDDLHASGVRFRSAPVAIDAGVNSGGWAVYMVDPDGIPIELFQPAKGGSA